MMSFFDKDFLKIFVAALAAGFAYSYAIHYMHKNDAVVTPPPTVVPPTK